MRGRFRSSLQTSPSCQNKNSTKFRKTLSLKPWWRVKETWHQRRASGSTTGSYTSLFSCCKLWAAQPCPLLSHSGFSRRGSISLSFVQIAREMWTKLKKDCCTHVRCFYCLSMCTTRWKRLWAGAGIVGSGNRPRLWVSAALTAFGLTWPTSIATSFLSTFTCEASVKTSFHSFSVWLSSLMWHFSSASFYSTLHSNLSQFSKWSGTANA